MCELAGVHLISRKGGGCRVAATHIRPLVWRFAPTIAAGLAAAIFVLFCRNVFGGAGHGGFSESPRFPLAKSFEKPLQKGRYSVIIR